MTIFNLTVIFSVMFLGALLPSISSMTVLTRTLTHGYYHGLFVSLGIVLGDVIYILIAIFGLSVLVASLGQFFLIIQFLGGVYLLFLGISLWRSKPNAVVQGEVVKSSLLSSFLAGLIITLSDQKAILFYLGFLPAFIELSSVSYRDVSIIIVITLVAVGGAKLCYVFAAHRANTIISNSKILKVFKIFSASLLIATGLFIIFSMNMTQRLSHAGTLNSTCYGSTKKGRLENGVMLPSAGKNFTSYGYIPTLLGRSYVHSTVKKVVIESYKNLAKIHPGYIYKYAESGFERGGLFKPHKTHQNGLSIDFMVPVFNNNKKSVYFPSNALNRYGYDVNFDSNGKNQNYEIDFDALGAHLVELNKAALNNGISLWRVLFAPDLQKKLYAGQYGRYIKKHILIPNKKSWVRHDEHYHVDFRIKCKSL